MFQESFFLEDAKKRSFLGVENKIVNLLFTCNSHLHPRLQNKEDKFFGAKNPDMMSSYLAEEFGQKKDSYFQVFTCWTEFFVAERNVKKVLVAN